jgi:4-amino-4-deoxychorismate lyase
VRTRYIIGLEGSIDPTDRGIAYGDGLFETMALDGGIIERLQLHLERLAAGCERLVLPMPDQSELEQKIAEAVAGIDRGSLKLILTRGTGPRGYLPPPSPDPTVILLAEAQSREPAAEIRVATLSSRLGENEALAGIKHLNRLEQVLARLELSHLDADEGLMLSTRGIAIGGTSRNLVAVYGDAIATPLIDRAGIAGIMRRSVLEQCERMHIKAVERELAAEELHHADELFMTNALVGVQSVTHLDQTRFRSRAMAIQLRQALGRRAQRGADHG